MFGFIKKVFASKDIESIEAVRKYQQVYNTPEGKWVIEDILKNLCNYGGSCIGKDDQSTYLKLGAHNVGLEITQRVTADLSKLQEQKNKEEFTDDEIQD